MNSFYTYQIFTRTTDLPNNWNDLAHQTIFLSKEYLEVLEKSAPENMTCHYIGLFENDSLVGIAISQFLDLNQLKSFGDRDKCIKKTVRNFILKNFSSHVLILGNNMLTGQNAFSLSQKITLSQAIKLLKLATEDLKKRFQKNGKKIHITTFKDLNEGDKSSFSIPDFKDNYCYSIQPNMVLDVNKSWKSEQDYIDSLSKKYRDQYKRTRKKGLGIQKRKMHLDEIIAHEDIIYDLYIHVAKNAPFNTFYLAKNHFRVLKEKLKDNFLFYGYFLDSKLIGFNTLIKNGETIDTYFLGYDETLQREKMLYLNMLYDMIAFTINNGFSSIVFSRTALEIKSSVGAKPIEMYGYMQHSNSNINKLVSRIFPYLEPETIWQQRNPFK